MNSFTHEAITQRARQIWENYGRPEGRDEEIWFEAEKQLNAESSASPSHPPKNSSPHTLSEADSDHAKNEQAAERRKEALAPQTPHKSAPKNKPAPPGKPLWDKPHSK